jgi:MFS transporter, DHA2 family, multidrug resistance protein
VSTQASASGFGALTSASRAVAAFGVALGTFMQVLDTTIANVSIPVIAGNLGVSADQGTWVITSFAVSNGIAVPLTGWFMQRFGLVRTFVVALLMFTVASFLCGIAWSLPSLILFRVMQGFFSGPLIPGSQALLLTIFPPNRRTLALAIWSMTTLIAPIVGPILGGYISDNYSWPWIFLINLPVGAVSGFLCWRLLGKRDAPGRKLPVDRVGIFLLVVWVGALQIMLDKGKDADWFASPLIVVLTVIAALGFVAFLIWELTEKHPIVDLSLLKYRNFLLGTCVNSLGYALFFGNLLIFPLWLQTQLNYTATWAGLVSTPAGMVAVFLTPFVGKFLSRFDARWFATAALLAFGASYFMRAGLTTEASFADFTAPLLVQGIGMAMFFISTVTIMLQGLPQKSVPAASGLSNFIRITAGSFAASVVTTFWDRHAAFHQSHLAEHSGVSDPAFRSAMEHLEGIGLSSSQAFGVLSRSLGIQAYAMSAFDFFWISGWLVFALIILVWATRPPKGSGHSPVVAAAD